MADNTINYDKWRELITKTQFIIVLVIFLVEVINNTLLFVTQSQGYNSQTIGAKLMRYLLLTSVINFGVFFLSQAVVKKFPKRYTLQKYVLVIATVLIAGDVSYSHYQFAGTFCLYVVPICFTIFYEDKRLCTITALASAVPMTISCVARGTDPKYGADIYPEAAIAFATIFGFYMVARYCIDNAKKTRERLDKILLYEEAQKHAALLEEKNRELEELSIEIINALSKAVDYNDPYTAGHSRRVGEYSRKIAERLGMNDDECQEVYFSGLLHDVGKIGIDNNIINKPGKLSDSEFSEMKKHPTMGYEILKGIVMRESYAAGAKFHHERIDGKGYPNHISDIPLIGRIISVADAYDAMTSKRSYRDTLPQETVRAEIEKNMGTQFDPDVARVMLELIDEDTDYDMRQKE